MYAGLGPSIYAIVPSMGLNFTLYENLKTLLATVDPSPNSFTAWKSGLIGGAAGGLSKFLVFPLVRIPFV